MRKFMIFTALFLLAGCAPDLVINEIQPGDNFRVMAITANGYDIEWTRTEVLSYDGNTHNVFTHRKVVEIADFKKLRKKPIAVGDRYLLHAGELLTWDELAKEQVIVFPGSPGK
jgi:hypothetical protein